MTALQTAFLQVDARWEWLDLFNGPPARLLQLLFRRPRRSTSRTAAASVGALSAIAKISRTRPASSSFTTRRPPPAATSSWSITIGPMRQYFGRGCGLDLRRRNRRTERPDDRLDAWLARRHFAISRCKRARALDHRDDADRKGTVQCGAAASVHRDCEPGALIGRWGFLLGRGGLGGFLGGPRRFC